MLWQAMIKPSRPYTPAEVRAFMALAKGGDSDLVPMDPQRVHAAMETSALLGMRYERARREKERGHNLLRIAASAAVVAVGLGVLAIVTFADVFGHLDFLFSAVFGFLMVATIKWIWVSPEDPGEGVENG